MKTQSAERMAQRVRKFSLCALLSALGVLNKGRYRACMKRTIADRIPERILA